MKIKKNLAVILTIACVISFFAGCGDKKEADKSASGEKMTISWLGYPYGNCEEGTVPQQLLEEKFNVKIEPVFLDEDAYVNKKPLLMASGNIPDIIYELDPGNLQADVRQGFLAELPYGTIKKYAPSVVGMINEEIPELWLYSYCDGKNYGVPNLYYSGENIRVGLWRKDWLDNVGITKIPETIDEMHDAFVKFVNEDPDGNGKKDTYGLSGDLKSSYISFCEIFGAYGVLPFDWMEKDGKIVYGGIQPETKEVLSLLADWYKEGIIDPEFITDATNKSISTKFKNGILGYINNYGADYGNLDATQEEKFLGIMKKLNPAAELAVAPLPKGPEGKQGSFVWGKGGHIVALGKQVAQQPEKQQRILEMMEVMKNDQDFSLQLVLGTEGVSWEKNTSEEGGINWIAPYDTTAQRAKLLGSLELNGTSFYNIIPINKETRNAYTPKTQREHNEKYLDPSLGMKDALLKPDVVPESEKYLKDLQNKQLLLFAKIIKGEKSVADYAEFEKEWNELGGKILEENANALYGELQKIYEQVGIK